MHNHTQARNECSLRANVPHNDKPRSGDIICLSDNIATAWLPKVETKNPVRDSTKITDRIYRESVANAVFRRTVYPRYNQPQSGLHNIYPLCNPIQGGRYPPEDSTHCVHSAYPVGYFCGIPNGLFCSLLHK